MAGPPVLDVARSCHKIELMFTGLVEASGVLVERAPRGPGARLVLRAELGGEPLATGESIAIDGACLSVTEKEARAGTFAVDATAETLARTTLGSLPLGARVNLERSLRLSDRLGGHLVTGHVDGVGSLATRQPVGDALALTFALPPELAPFVAQKGSIALNGVSMTVNGVRAAEVDVMVIPITREETNLGALAPGDRVNIEVDLVARYVARWMEGRDRP
jgi:riboflavin synthase